MRTMMCGTTHFGFDDELSGDVYIGLSTAEESGIVVSFKSRDRERMIMTVQVPAQDMKEFACYYADLVEGWTKLTPLEEKEFLREKP